MIYSGFLTFFISFVLQSGMYH
ncbi:MAG: hypothetical protein JRF06_00095 [Deltaproteobacteria bacterium]|nr:hypothetical protein [Deltaproteobacteria bacterium]